MNKNVTVKISKKIIVGIVAVLAAICIIIVLVLSSQSSPINISGGFSLGDFTKFGNMKAGEDCKGAGGYDDINSNTQVTIKNGQGSLLSVTDLGVGLADGIGNCNFKFNFTDVPKSDLFSIEVSHRGEVIYSYDKLVENDNYVYLSLGEVEEQKINSAGDPQYITLPSKDEATQSIKTNATKKWNEDYSMTQYEINSQTEAYDWLASIQKDNPKILQWSLKKWNDDFTMVKYEYEQQLKAFNSL